MPRAIRRERIWRSANVGFKETRLRSICRDSIYSRLNFEDLRSIVRRAFSANCWKVTQFIYADEFDVDNSLANRRKNINVDKNKNKLIDFSFIIYIIMFKI